MIDHDEPQVVERAVRADGAFLWRAFLPPADTEDLGRRCRDLVASPECEVQSRSLRVWDLFAHGDEFDTLLLDSRLRQLCTSLLGHGYLLSDFSINAVHQEANQDPWHVDYPYNETLSPVSSPTPLGLQCVLAVSPFTVANGGTEFLPRSHQRPHLHRSEHLPTARCERFEGNPGDLLVMHANTWHRAGLNTTADLRIAVVLSFVQRWIRPIVAPRDIADTIDSDTSEDLLIMLGAVVLEEIDSRTVRRKVV